MRVHLGVCGASPPKWRTIARLFPLVTGVQRYKRMEKEKKTPDSSAADFVPRNPTLLGLRRAAKSCRGCELWKYATQTVFGEGPSHSRVIIVGEQPGDKEDLQGHPFVGPAGRVLERALQESGIRRSEIYITNAVKHFKSEPRGKRRIHKKPNSLEIAACKPWLEAEIHALQPDIIVCLGATAAQALLGSTFRVTVSRGKFLRLGSGKFALATVHPSSILRIPDEESRQTAMREFVGDLKQVRAWLDRLSQSAPSRGRKIRVASR
jgi:uracil-DNA glycosylase